MKKSLIFLSLLSTEILDAFIYTFERNLHVNYSVLALFYHYAA